MAIAVPVAALALLPILKEEQLKYWPTMPIPSALAAQVQKESCITLKHSKCWNVRAELKTDREYGFGLGQITITKKFNVFEELKASNKALADWRWEDRFNARYQLRAIVIKDLQCNNMMRNTATQLDRLKMAFSCCNGGGGGVLKDRRLCSNTAGCDPRVWDGNVELTSFKSRTAVKGYGQSFYAINRGYVKALVELQPHRAKYVPYME